MMEQLIIRAEAENDISEAAVWYESKHEGLGTQFLAEVDSALERITANPRQYRRLRRKPEVRRVLPDVFHIAFSMYCVPTPSSCFESCIRHVTIVSGFRHFRRID
jgi:hypothetical protein